MESLWGKTTSLSKVLAVVVFCALPFLGFYLGTKYGEVQNELPRLELQAQQNRNNSPRYKEEPLQSIGSPAVEDSSTEILNTSSTVDTSNWKTYRNDKYGFEIKYLSNWNFEATTLYDNVKKKNTGDFEYYITNTSSDRLIIEPTGINGDITPLKFFNVAGKIVIDGISATLYKLSDNLGTNAIVVNGLHNTKYPDFSFYITTDFNSDRDLNQKEIIDFKNILSTFKFIK